MAKRPAPGQTKTRLVPPLSTHQSAGLYECFLKDTLALVRQASARTGCLPVLAFLPVDEAAYFSRLAPGFECLPQQGDDLGARLDHALTHFLTRGYGQVAIMNSDGPTLPLACLEAAFLALEEADVCLGPCEDGGYYLIGLKQPAPRLLREVRMSTPQVTADTLALARAENLEVSLLPAWYDVDDAASLARLQADLDQAPPWVASHTRAFLTSLTGQAFKAGAQGFRLPPPAME